MTSFISKTVRSIDNTIIRISTIQLVVLLFVCLPSHSFGITLQEELEKQGIDVTSANISNLDKNITSYATLNDEKSFCVAYYLDKGQQWLDDILYVSLLQKSTNQWIENTLDYKTLISDDPHFSTGSVMGIHSTPNFLYLDTHINPSAGHLLVLKKDDLTFYDAFLAMWIMALFEDETVVYRNHEIHFAPTHPAEVSLYFPYTREHRKIYPMKPYQKIRLQHIAKVRAEYKRRGEQWFQNHNHHMEPELFTNGVDSQAAINDQTNSLGFLVFYDNTETWKPGVLWSLYYMRNTRNAIQQVGIQSPISEKVFFSLAKDLKRVNELCCGNKKDFLALFDDDPSLQDMVQKIMRHEFDDYVNLKAQFVAIHSDWISPQTWRRLREIIEIPGAISTEVVYIYKNVMSKHDMTYREVLLADLKEKYGEQPLSAFLTPERLQELFKEY